MTSYVRRIANVTAIFACGVAAWATMWLSVSGLG
ncbi:hypothetical protein DE4585_01851 [Mycobacteroides salmoniphilum]|uniref:Uncharacterized protein n=1 Tax=Mycobacteroides salmoniphilum TaxID=404941 RepID=A0A4R8S1I9_9MYCO|nr:hypothetical protein DE4586_03373 [Mycobacteroides salmoniphilum]TDZ83056.1 hypothetical protein DE4585_01851 [Mycobacteroides salmoniphilum]TDZ83999.1 hypothetical protein DE4587_02915 [Mycobacteroides salmoniphilum]TDZ95516.1 hypothetical protein CCUG60885_01650 [Mycobacteroides salmoniphilum]TEA04612.1 hypothetical protein CCUG60883_01908 [Mycobacteroides salmoniphilum]